MALNLYDYEYTENGRPHGARFTLGSKKFEIYADRLPIFTTKQGVFLVHNGEEYHIPPRIWNKLKPRLVQAPVHKEELAKYERYYNMLTDKEFRVKVERNFKKLSDSLGYKVQSVIATDSSLTLTSVGKYAIQLEINPNGCLIRFWDSKKRKFFDSDLDKRFQAILVSIAKSLVPHGYNLKKKTKVSGLMFTAKTPQGKPYVHARGIV